MDLSSLLGFVSIAGWIIAIAGGAIAVNSMSQRHNARPGVLLAVAGVILGAIFFLLSNSLVLVGPTEVAVVFQSVGGDPATNSLWPTPLGPGVHIVMPIINQPFIYSTEVRTYTMSKTPAEGAVSGDDSVSALTADGQQIYIDVSVLYSIDPTKANVVHLKYQNRFETDYVRPTVRAAVRDILSGYNVQEVYGNKKTEITNKIRDTVSAEFATNGLKLVDLPVRNITFSDLFIKAVEDKQVAQQQAEQALQEADKARTQAQGQADAAVISAKGQSDALVAKAQGQAQATELQAAADAKALALISVQITQNPNLIEWRYIDKLASNISMVLLPSNSPFLFDANSLIKQAQAASTANDGTTGSTTGTTSAATPVAPTPAPSATPSQ